MAWNIAADDQENIPPTPDARRQRVQDKLFIRQTAMMAYFNPKHPAYGVPSAVAEFVSSANKTVSPPSICQWVKKLTDVEKARLRRGEVFHIKSLEDKRASPRKPTAVTAKDLKQIQDLLLQRTQANHQKFSCRDVAKKLGLDPTTVWRHATKTLNMRLISPFYSDILTPAMKLKRMLFCKELLQLPEAAFFAEVKSWMFWDEKWWDLHEPAGPLWVNLIHFEINKSSFRPDEEPLRRPSGGCWCNSR
jgi:hypothetical protein